MERNLVEFSLVALAGEHNPTILNPDFLARNQIVRDDWEWRVIGQPITTPAIATVRYDSKVIITVEPTKLQVTDNSGAAIEQNNICTILSNYVRNLPHVQYNALGINFTTLTMVEDAEDANVFLIDRYLEDGPWNSEQNPIQGVGYKFLYELANGQITFSIDKGSRPEVDKPFIVSRANFHRNLNLENMPTSNQIVDILSNVQNDWERFENLYRAIIEE